MSVNFLACFGVDIVNVLRKKAQEFLPFQFSLIITPSNFGHDEILYVEIKLSEIFVLNFQNCMSLSSQIVQEGPAIIYL